MIPEPGIPCLPASMSRLSFTESIKYDRTSSFSVKPELVDNRMFPLRNGNMLRPSASSKSPSSPYGSSPGSLSFIVHDSRVFSQSPSPVLGKRSSTPSPSPSFSFRTLEATPDELKSSNDILSMELKDLRQQVSFLLLMSIEF